MPPTDQLKLNTGFAPNLRGQPAAPVGLLQQIGADDMVDGNIGSQVRVYAPPQCAAGPPLVASTCFSIP